MPGDLEEQIEKWCCNIDNKELLKALDMLQSRSDVRAQRTASKIDFSVSTRRQTSSRAKSYPHTKHASNGRHYESPMSQKCIKTWRHCQFIPASMTQNSYTRWSYFNWSGLIDEGISPELTRTSTMLLSLVRKRNILNAWRRY